MLFLWHGLCNNKRRTRLRQPKSFSESQDDKLPSYQIKIEIKPYKADEFVKSIHSFSSKIRKQKGCLNFRVYQDSDKENTYIVVGDWKTRQAMEKHFQTQNFEVLIGAAKVLGETFEMNIAEVSKTGGFELARELMVSKQQRKTEAD